MGNLSASNIFFAASGGLLPVLFWLWFWLKEDPHPEPRSVLFNTFLSGMVATGAAMAIELLVFNYVSDPIIYLFLWAIAEECVKFAAAYNSGISTPFFDEPVDAVIYMITAALGFASFENILFLIKAYSSSGLLSSFITGNLRFVGATLLHVATSGIVGASIAYSFFHKEKRHYNIIGGLILASALHFAFNYFIMKNEGYNMLKIFIPLWIGIIILIFLIERIKKIKN